MAISGYADLAWDGPRQVVGYELQLQDHWALKNVASPPGGGGRLEVFAAGPAPSVWHRAQRTPGAW